MHRDGEGCNGCHGAQGAGNQAVAKLMHVTMPNLASKVIQAKRTPRSKTALEGNKAK